MAKKKKQKHHEEEGGEAWLLPYSDLMTLLLAVFIVLFAVSKVDEKKAESMANSFQENMMSGSEGILSGDGDAISPITSGSNNSGSSQEENTDTDQDDTTVTQEELEQFLGQFELGNLEDLKAELDSKFENDEITSNVTTKIDKRGLVISLSNAILFDTGSAEIKMDNKDALLEIAESINELDYYIRIEGHTDNVPIHSTAYPSNWELSTARAASVVKLFIDSGHVSPEKLVAVGYGEYKPIANNATTEGRAKNRRIDIIILSEKYNNLED